MERRPAVGAGIPLGQKFENRGHALGRMSVGRISRGADLSEANLNRTELIGSDFSGANLVNLAMIPASIRSARKSWMLDDDGRQARVVIVGATRLSRSIDAMAKDKLLHAVSYQSESSFS